MARQRRPKGKGAGRPPFRITPEEAKAEAARLRERRDAADRDSAPLFAKQLGEDDLVSGDQDGEIAEYPPFKVTSEDAKAEGARLRERLRAADIESAYLFAQQLAEYDLIEDDFISDD